MAKIVMEMDTVDKTMSVTMDGEKLSDVVYVQACCSNRMYNGAKYEEDEADAYGVRIEMAYPNKEGGYAEYHCITAAKSEDGKKEIQCGAKPHKNPEFVTLQYAAGSIADDIKKYYGVK